MYQNNKQHLKKKKKSQKRYVLHVKYRLVASLFVLLSLNLCHEVSKAFISIVVTDVGLTHLLLLLNVSNADFMITLKRILFSNPVILYKKMFKQNYR